MLRYYETISEVLSSVRKMEESLKRLKQARKGANTTTTAGANGGPTDDSKIRLQLALDVEYLGEQVGCIWWMHKHRQIHKCDEQLHIHQGKNIKYPTDKCCCKLLEGCVKLHDDDYFLSYTTLYCCVSQIQKMGLQPSDISMFSSLMDLVKEARELAEQNQ